MFDIFTIYGRFIIIDCACITFMKRCNQFFFLCFRYYVFFFTYPSVMHRLTNRMVSKYLHSVEGESIFYVHVLIHFSYRDNNVFHLNWNAVFVGWIKNIWKIVNISFHYFFFNFHVFKCTDRVRFIIWENISWNRSVIYRIYVEIYPIYHEIYQINSQKIPFL